MKYFGEYLIHHKIVSAENLVKATIEQMESQPVASKIAFEIGLLSAEEMILIFKFQQENKTHFLDAAQKTKILTADKRDQLELELSKRSTSLATILLNKGYVELKDLVRSLDEFISESKASGQSPATSNSSSPSVPSPLAVSEDGDMTFNSIDGSSATQLAQIFSKEKMNELINVLQLVKQNATMKDLVHEFMDDSLKTIVKLKEVAHDHQGLLVEKVLETIEGAMSKVVNGQTSEPDRIAQVIVPSIEAGLHFCSEATTELEKNRNDSVFWQKPEARAQFKDFT
ncbi:MAG: hypothetical protein RJB66_1535, partial [Pseudomonadota bacterium]